jgi:hypothetical protein
VPDYLMFGLFLAVFAVYFLLILRPWRLVPGLCRLNRSLGLPSVHRSAASLSARCARSSGRRS